MPFPLPFVPKESYRSGGRRFGAEREGGKRKHAGCDLIAPLGTPIYAVDDGVVMEPPRAFYRGTWQLAIKHANGYLVRYCEVLASMQSPELRKMRPGARVTAGQIIARVGKMYRDSMLHFEVYAGTAGGPLTVKSNVPYQRRSDLLNPTDLLNRLCQKVQMSHAPVMLSQSLGARR